MKTRTNLNIALAIAGAATITTSSLAFAQDEEAGFEPSVEFSGFVDGSVTTTFYAGDGAPEDNDPVGFGLDQAEIDITAQPTERLTLQFDLNFFPGSGAITPESILEQAYLEYWRSTDGTGVFTKFGMFNAPIGAEALDPVDMYQYSQGLLFTYAAPTNLTGLSVGYATESFVGQFLITNDWDASYSPGDLSLGARGDYLFDSGSVGAVVLASSLIAGDASEITVDVDANFSSGDLTLFGEVTFATLVGDAVPDDTDSISYGFMAKANYALSDAASITGRVSYLNRYEDMFGGAPLGRASYHGIEASLAGLFTISENFGALVEVRMDKLLGDMDNETIAITPSFELTAMF